MTRIPFDAETIERLAGILDLAGLTELELQDGEQRLRLVRAPAVALAAVAPVAVTPVAVATPASVSADEPPPPVGAVTSPMVGIAYLAAEPGAAPFVTVGAPVVAGQTVVLIEAMKTFNAIKAPHSGTVTQILVTTGQPVEYGQPLVVIA